MPTIANYNQFGGRHWETGSVHNFMAQRGFVAPHTGRPYSEALLLGVSGGITFGYFTFAYEGYDPQCNILTRNTFDPLDTLLSRLGVVQYLEHTRSAERAVEILTDTLADGQPAIVWADLWSLPYNGLGRDEGMWGAFPIVVYGYEPQEDVVYIADRAGVPLTITTGELAAARGRIKKEKFRLLTVDAPNPDKLASAVQLGIWDAIRLFTEKPPKGSANNFGLTGLQYWAKMLANPKQRASWEKLFPAGRPMYAGLTTAYEFAFLFGKGLAQDAERAMYAGFLEEVAVILNRPALNEAAELYRTSAAAWQKLPARLLPDEVSLLSEARQLMGNKHRLFLEQGGAALAEIEASNGRLKEIRQTMIDDFPLGAAVVADLRERLAEQVMAVHAAEQVAVSALRGAIT
jgi:hypothetical protein